MATRQFIVDEEGRAKAVVLSIEEYNRLLERLGDADELALIEERRSEPDMFLGGANRPALPMYSPMPCGSI
jgi:hypothetical protein